MRYIIYLQTVLLFSGCSFFISQKSDNISETKRIQTFIPVEVDGGLIEMEKNDLSDYITPEMVLITRGSFVMGDSTKSGTKNERPPHKVNIDYEFFISKKEITFEEYDKFVKDTKRISPNDEGWGREDRPVVNVSYNDAKDYLKWLSRKSGDKYRLPTESEWEYVARSGSNSRFFFGDSVKDIKHYSWYWKNSEDGSHKVGEKLPNSWNIYDISGNVWEWCEDWYVNDLNAIPKNGRAYSVSTGERVIKGGSWNDFPLNLRHSNRLGFTPTIKMNDTGFRAVMEY